jgi:hypothetical protein
MCEEKGLIGVQFYRKRSTEITAFLLCASTLSILRFPCKPKYSSICRNSQESWFKKFCRIFFLRIPVETWKRFVFDVIQMPVNKVNRQMCCCFGLLNYLTTLKLYSSVFDMKDE